MAAFPRSLLPLAALLAALPLAGTARANVTGCDEAAIYADAPPSATPFLDRAFAWVHAGAMYCQCVTAATSPYRADCSGMVSYAWGMAPPGHTTHSLGGGQWDDGQSVVIGWDELTIGDALNFPGDPSKGVGHVMLFGGWLDAAHTQLCAIEESSTGTPAHISKHSLSNPGSWWGGSGTFGGIYLPIRLAGYSPTPPNQAPRGWMDRADCEVIGGWAQDQDAPDQVLDVHLYFDGSPGDPGAQAIAVHADAHRDDLCQAIGSCNHGFSTATPRSLLDGQAHTVRAYGIDTAGGNNPILSGSPLTFQCAPPAPPLDAQHGVKRWITSPAAFAAWRFDWLRDLAHEGDEVVASFPVGPDLPEAPLVVRADDGSPEVWVIDTWVRRHVTDPASLAAWRFDAVTVKPAAEVQAYPVGPDFPAAPFVFAGASDPKAYLLDVPMLPPAQGEVGAGGSSGGTGGSGGTGAVGSPSDEPRSASGCQAAGSSGGAGISWVAAALALVAARRRRDR